MNDQQIFALMAKTPGIRAVQISDRLDKDLKEVSEALRELVEAGSIVKRSGTAPNGQPAMIYDFSEEFKASREYAALAQVVPDPVLVDPVLPVAATAAPAKVEAVVRAAAAGPSRAERAIAAILERGPLSDTDLRAVMGIKDQVYPSTYLGAAVKAGKVHKGPDGWVPGAAAPVPAPVVPVRFNTPINPDRPVPAGFAARATPEPVENVVLVGNTILVSKDHKAIAPEVVAAVTAAELAGLPPAVLEQLSKPARATAAAAPAPAVFRCGLWSDGVLELQRDGAQVARLTRGEGEHLAAFMTRMLGAAEGAAATK